MIKKTTFFLFLCLTLCLSLTLCQAVQATTIFSDGFESGDFSAWTGTSNAPSVAANQVHHGSWGFEATSAGTAKYCYKTIAETHLFTRSYIRFDALPSAGTYIVFHQIIGTGELLFANALLYNDGGTYKWGFRYRTAGSYPYIYSGEQTNPSVDRWYCLEFEILPSTADGNLNGEYRMYINGLLLSDIEKTGIDTDLTTTTQARITTYETSTNNPVVYQDCVVIAGAYIEPETEEENSFSLVLNTPANESTITEYTCDFNYTPTLLGSDNFQNATLYLNGTATAYNQTAIVNATQNTISYVLPGQNATYLWDVQVWNSTHALFSTNGNFTVNVQVTAGVSTETEEEYFALGFLALIIGCAVTGVCVAALRKQKK